MWVTARNIHREFARGNMEVKIEDVDPSFPLEVSYEEKGGTTESSKPLLPRFWNFTDKKIFLKN